jgi:hypothetical protein
MLTATISLSRKINLGNYESADVFLSVGNVTLETTEEELVALLDGPAQMTYQALAERVRHRAATIRNQKEV